MSRALAGVLILAVLGAAFFFRSTQASQAQPPVEPVYSVLLTLGEGASAVEPWDGTARVERGKLIHTEGRLFSANDSVTGEGAWKATTRRDEVVPFADLHYTEMRSGEKPEIFYHPVGVFLTVRSNQAPQVAVETKQGSFSFAISELSAAPKAFLNGRATVQLVPATEKITADEYQNDEPAVAALSDGSTAVAWVAYRDRADRVLMRTVSNGRWSGVEEVSHRKADVFRCALASDWDGGLWAFWSERVGDAFQIFGRRKRGGKWDAPQTVSTAGTNGFLRAASGPDGTVAVAWQSFRGGPSDIYLRSVKAGAWSAEARVSESPANDWEPAIAVGKDGTVWVAWDTYDKGNYDVMARSYRAGVLGPTRPVTSSPKFQAHASVAVDGEGRAWVAWDESGVNWGKDQGFLIPTPLATPLHQVRSVRVEMWDGKAWQSPQPEIAEALPERMRMNAEHPQLAFDGAGGLQMVFRHWTRRNDRTIGSPMEWDNYCTRYDGARWSTPVPLANSAGHIEKHAAITRSPDGDIAVAWMTDGRLFANAVPRQASIYFATLKSGGRASMMAWKPMTEPFLEAIPVHNTEPADVRAIRAYRIGARRIVRGDMHRHTDFSQDFKYDGSLLEVYRYALDAAAFDYIAPTDHQAGYDQEFTWWQNQKLVDLFFVPGMFTPLYAYERSVLYPNGHRNVIFDHRGVRTLPIPPAEQQGREGAKSLFAYLHKNNGISMPHSSATNQGTDWRDNDPEVEPLMEIYQGYRNSYEYEGAPRAATALNPHAQKSGWQPSGFYWNALKKGYKLGVQASSDHWSTHISYAMLLVEQQTREGLLDAIRKRHAYGATDNIVLDLRAVAGGRTYIMGDSFSASGPVQLVVKAMGTTAIKQVDVVRDGRFVYTVRPGVKQAGFEYVDRSGAAGEHWYYVRVLQEDGGLAWSSPVWVRR